MRISLLGLRNAMSAVVRRRLISDERGTTAIEFGILAVPFFVIVAAILETGLVFFASQTLDSAVGDASRLIRTKQAQSAGMDISGFRTQICNHLFGMFDCNNLKIKVDTLADFSAASTTDPVDPKTGNWTITSSYNAGTSSDIVLVQVYYKWPLAVNFGGFNLAQLPDGTLLMSAIRVFRNEP